MGQNKNVGFISFRISGTDGVSLETKKWVDVFQKHDYQCFFMAGELDTPPEYSFVVDEAHFKHPEIVKLYQLSFDRSQRPRELTEGIHHYREILKKKLYEFVERFDIGLLIPQNTLTIPLNVPLGLALTEFIAETSIPVIAHHHDFFWERKRFLTNCVWDYFNSAYPPHLPSVHHVVINSSAQNQLALRTGISSTLIPNVMNFEEPPNGRDDYNVDVRRALGIDDDELLVLQPTRVVQRKGIEHAIELVARLNMKATLVISHASGDEGYEYQTRVQEYAELLGIKARFVDDIIGDHRGRTPDGRKVYTLGDIYPYADLVTYPSIVEGFGNAFLEAIYHRKPILVNNYSIYSHDIKPKGFDVIEMDDFISKSTVEYTKEVLTQPQRIQEMVETNYRLGLKYYSYSVLETKLRHLTTSIWGSKQFRDI
ncbi:MAG TPA: glycosyltransferase [Sediminispirochaeta sp.]|nr:glycosyltransferase [Sediminispirochaeta sp.]